MLPEERAAICEYALQFPRVGYRKLTWMMVDDAVACVGESTVYRVLSDADLLSRWKRSTIYSGEYNFRPKAPHQQWHTDVMYIWVAARCYFLLSFVDAFSRYIVHHKLLITLDGKSVSVELQRALETLEGAKPRIVHDHGSEFVNRDIGAVIKAHNLIDIKTRPRHPESNGIAERFNGTGKLDLRATEERRTIIRTTRLGRAPKPMRNATSTRRMEASIVGVEKQQSSDGSPVVVCAYCSTLLAAEHADWRHGTIQRERDLAERLADAGIWVQSRQSERLAFVERLCPGCGIELDNAIVRAADVSVRKRSSGI